MVRIPPVESFVGQEGVRGGKGKYYPSPSAKRLLKAFFELNPPTHLVPSHPTTSFSADQMIQFARAVGLEVSLASYGMLEDLLLKARVGGGDQTVGSRHSIGRSLFPSVAGSDWVDSVASSTNTRCQLSQRLMLAEMWQLMDSRVNHALVNKLMRV